VDRADVPHQRIIESDMWQKVKARQEATALGKHDKSKAEGFWDRRLPRFLLSGLLKCSGFGSTFVKISQKYFDCTSARNKGTCEKDDAQLQKVISELDQMIDAICDGLPAERVKDRMISLEAERAEIVKRLDAVPVRYPKRTYGQNRCSGLLGTVGAHCHQMRLKCASNVPQMCPNYKNPTLESEAFS